MMRPASDAHELNDLVAALIDETITPEQRARLQALLRDELMQRHFVETMGMHASLYTSAGEIDHAAATERTSGGWSRGKRWKAWLGGAARRITRPTPLSFSVATIVMCLLVLAMAYIVVPIYHARQHELAATTSAPRIVAKVSRAQDAIWAEGQIGIAPGSHLLAGRRLQLKSGLAEVTFKDGAVVTVKGPARFVVDDSGVATLLEGRIRANVPQAAVGFKVSTPLLDIVDLGTEFGVEVNSEATTEVHVLKGRVAVSPTNRPDATQKNVVLGKGQAWQVTSGGGAGRAVLNAPQQFALSIVDPNIVVLQAGQVNDLTGNTYDGVDDVQLLAWAPTFNFGGRVDFDVGQLRGQRAHTLLRFDLSSLDGKLDRLLGVTLRLHPNKDLPYFPWGGPGEIHLHRVSDANADWVEGKFAAGGSGPLSGSTDATWNLRQHPNVRWAGAGGASQAGVDFDATPLAKTGYLPQTGVPVDLRFTGDLAFMRDWIAGKPNGGFLLREVSGRAQNRITFHSSESPSVAARPQLIVSYLPKSVTDGKHEAPQKP